MSDVIDWNDIKNSVSFELGEVRRGWVRIVSYALEQVNDHCVEHGSPRPVILEIKEKSGSLRLDYSCSSEDFEINDLLDQAITRTNGACEHCGNACTTQLLVNRPRNLCCWCAHQIFEERGQKPVLNITNESADRHLRCLSCGYVGQIAWKASGFRCPACVSKGLG